LFDKYTIPVVRVQRLQIRGKLVIRFIEAETELFSNGIIRNSVGFKKIDVLVLWRYHNDKKLVDSLLPLE